MGETVRILQVSGTLNQGGAENMNMNILRVLDRSKLIFDFVEHTEAHAFFEDEITDLGGRVYHAPKYRVINHFQYKKWWEKFFKDHPEYKVVHSHVRSTAAIILSAAKKAGLKTIAHSHNTSNGRSIGEPVKKILQGKITKYADYFFACSDDAGRWLFPGKEFIVFKNAIDSEKYSFSEKTREAVRNELNLSEGCFVVGTVGRLTDQKNPYGILEIFKHVVAERPDAKLLWVGDGEKRKEIEKYINDKNLAAAVMLIGERPDVYRVLQAMDVFIFPSLWEGLGIVAVEAQAAGLPCLCSTRVPGEVAITDLCEFLPLDNPKAWVERILNVKSERKDMSASIKAAGYDICETSRWLEDFYYNAMQ